MSKGYNKKPKDKRYRRTPSKRPKENKSYINWRNLYWDDGKHSVRYVAEELRSDFLSANNNPPPFSKKVGTVGLNKKFHYFLYPTERYNVNGKVVGYDVPSVPQPLTFEDDNFKVMHQQCLLSILGKIRQMKNNVHLGNFYGERHKTIEMLELRLFQAYKLLKRARKPLTLLENLQLRRPTNKKIAKKLASLRLEYAYGWKPLMGDIHSICKELNPPPQVIDVNTSRKRTVTRDFNSSGFRILQDFNLRVSMNAIVEMDSPLISSASSLGLINPLEVAWEVTPFSFVIDWFVPIGEYLENLSALNGLKIKSAGHTFQMTGTCSSTLLKNKSCNSNGVVRSSIRVYDSLKPPFIFFKPYLSVNRAVNALALITQLQDSYKPKRHVKYTE